MDFNFNGKKILNKDGHVKQYTLSTKDGKFKCKCNCNVFTRFEELYHGEEIYECNVCHAYWSGVN